MAHLALACVVEAGLPQLREPEYGYRLVRVRQQVRAHPNRPLVIVLGTSRTQNAINPRAMAFPDEPGSPMVFNFGQSGASPLHLRLTFQRLCADEVLPAAVLVELLPATLVVPGPADHLFVSSSARLTADDLPRLAPYCSDPSAVRRAWLIDRLNAFHAQRLVIVSHLAPRWLNWSQRLDHQWSMTDASGFCPYPANDVEIHRPARQAKVRAEYGRALERLRVSELSMRAYRDLVADCRARGIPVAFFLTPESPTVRSWYEPQSWAVLANFCRMLSEDLGCPVFAAPTDFAEEDFADGHHMLPSAAARFSRQLATRQLIPWLAEALK
ncbi:MAG: hypothetical protein L0241_10110 [Planctomycetia bacterium]|nr:hypothetical protein [Planctomycetia bacterium]